MKDLHACVRCQATLLQYSEALLNNTRPGCHGTVYLNSQRPPMGARGVSATIQLIGRRSPLEAADCVISDMMISPI